MEAVGALVDRTLVFTTGRFIADASQTRFGEAKRAARASGGRGGRGGGGVGRGGAARVYKWVGMSSVGGFLPQPQQVVWDRSGRFCALAYTRNVAIRWPAVRDAVF